MVAGVASWGTNGFGQGAATQPQGFGVRDVNTATPVANLLIGTKKPSDWFTDLGNKVLTTNANTGISSTLFLAGRPTFTINTAATDAISKGGAAPAGSFFAAVDYIGAFKDTDWTTKWAEFNPNAKDYSK